MSILVKVFLNEKYLNFRDQALKAAAKEAKLWEKVFNKDEGTSTLGLVEKDLNDTEYIIIVYLVNQGGMHPMTPLRTIVK